MEINIFADFTSSTLARRDVRSESFVCAPFFTLMIIGLIKFIESCLTCIYVNQQPQLSQLVSLFCLILQKNFSVLFCAYLNVSREDRVHQLYLSHRHTGTQSENSFFLYIYYSCGIVHHRRCQPTRHDKSSMFGRKADGNRRNNIKASEFCVLFSDTHSCRDVCARVCDFVKNFDTIFFPCMIYAMWRIEAKR